MKILNGKVFSNKGVFEETGVLVKGGLIEKTDKFIVEEDDDVFDATDCFVIPGLTDIHFHGCAGYDFCDASSEALENICRYQLINGITTIVPATMSYDEERLTSIIKNASDYCDKHEAGVDGADIIGINMEGPFISGKKSGAQNPLHIGLPDKEMFQRLLSAGRGLIKLCDMAPELYGAMEFIEEFSETVHISLAHTESDYEMALQAFSRGADHVTHLYNGMNGFDKRSPGIPCAVSDSENVYAEIIGDGIHISPAAIRTTIRMIGADRMVLISDSTRACGLGDGQYELGGQTIFVEGKECRLEDGTIAGSVTNLMECFRKLITDMNVPMETAVKMAAVNPVKSIGMFDRFGSLEPGKVANIVVLDKNLDIVMVVKNGEKVCIN